MNDIFTARSRLRPNFACLVTKRIFSVIFIIINLYMDWTEYALRMGSAEEPTFLVKLSQLVPFGSNKKRAGSLGYGGKLELQCKVDYEGAIRFFGFVCAMATLFAVFQIVNMIGETLLEYNGQKDDRLNEEVGGGQVFTTSFTNSDSHNKENDVEAGQENNQNSIDTKESLASRLSALKKGFQIIHGWNESVISVLLEDVPQLCIMILFSVECEMNLSVVLRVFTWNFFKDLKSAFRFDTCKHEYKPCCGDCCQDQECCVYSCNFCCICRIAYFRPCDCQRCFEIESYDICPDFTCKTCERAGQCFGPIDEDPRCAKSTFRLLQKLLVLLYAAVFVLQILSGFGVIGQETNVVSRLLNYYYYSGNK